MAARVDLADRLWRVRKRHDHIDAIMRKTPAGWQLQFARNDRPLVAWIVEDEQAARCEAARRLAELQRAGWVTHW